MGPFQPQLHKFPVSIAVHRTGPVRTPVHSPVMTQHEHAVFGHPDIHLHDIDTHAYHGLYGRDAVFRIIPPVSPVRHDKHLFR